MRALSLGNTTPISVNIPNMTINVTEFDVYKLISGGGFVDTLVVSSPDYCGEIILLCEGDVRFECTSGGNLYGGLGLGVTISDHACTAYYDSSTSKWYINP